MLEYLQNKVIFLSSTFLLALLLLAGCSNKLLNIDHPGWLLEEVASGRFLGMHSSLTVTSDGMVHLAYHDPVHNRLYYANRSAPTTWNSTRVDTVGWVGSSIVIRADDSDILHLLYQDSVVKSIRYTRFDGITWSSDYIGPTVSIGSVIELASRSGTLHLAELAVSETSLNNTYKVEYWNMDGSNWSHLNTIRYPGEQNITRHSIGFDLLGDLPTIAVLLMIKDIGNWEGYGEKANDLLGYQIIVYQYNASSTSPADAWSDSHYVDISIKEKIKTAREKFPKAVALIYDNQDLLHLIYRNTDGTLLDQAGETVDTGVANGFLRCRKGPGGDLWLLYQVGDGLALALRPDGGSWSRVGMISHADPDGRWDLLIDTDNVPHVSFYSQNGECLWYGRWIRVP
ncbi:hypothetical protein ACFL3H_05285 [Gemmatimonadota bacterium]